MMIVEIVTTLLFAWFVWFFVTTYVRRRSMPPGPFPFPLVGNIPQLDLSFTKPFKKFRQEYGDIFTLTLTEETVMVSTASLAREARLDNKDAVVGVSRESVYPFNIMVGSNDVVFSDYGTPYLFRKRVFKLAMHVFGAGINNVEERGSHAVKCTLEKIESLEGQPFSPKEIIASAILIQLWQWLTSQELSFDDPKLKLLLEYGEIMSKQDLGKSYIFQKIPFHSYLPTEFNRKVKRATDIKFMIYPPSFQFHMETYTPGVIRDMTDSFISAYEKEIAKETGKNIGSINDISELMLDVTLAGSDTTSSSMAWFILYMVLYPNVQEKIHDELDRVIGKEDLPRWQDVKNMPYLQATICEVMRKSSPVPVTGSNALRDVTLGGYHIPKGTLVILHLSQIHHDEREWLQPEEFKPERFLDVEGNFVGWNKFTSFLPFGLGRRECGGIAFAKIMLFTFASALLHRLRFELPEGAEKPNQEPLVTELVSSPRDFKVVAKKRH
jgi:hypothetical protein